MDYFLAIYLYQVIIIFPIHENDDLHPKTKLKTTPNQSCRHHRQVTPGQSERSLHRIPTQVVHLRQPLQRTQNQIDETHLRRGRTGKQYQNIAVQCGSGKHACFQVGKDKLEPSEPNHGAQR